MDICVKDIIRFWGKISVQPGNGTTACWNWLGHCTSDKGSGVTNPDFWIPGYHKVSARRISFLIHFGVEPAGQVVARCENPLCVNPNHLQNTLSPDYVVRQYKSHRKQHARDEKIVRKIITLHRLGQSQVAIARKLDINHDFVNVVLKMARLCHEGKLKPIKRKARV